MLVLALETSSLAASCALWRDSALLSEFYCNTGLTHSQTIMPMVEAALGCSRTPLDKVELFAVSTGPGSFTGLRIGLSAVKGMAMASRKPCAGVSTLHGLATGVRDFRGTIIPVMDARRSQVYTAMFECDDGTVNRIFEDTAISVKDLKERLMEIPGPKLLVGDGAAMCFSALKEMPGLSVAPPHLLHQRAACIAEIAAGMDESAFVSAGDLSPCYLRLPQAERELIEKEREY